MASKQEVRDIMKTVVSDRFIELWWDLKIPGLGMAKPGELWETDPERVLEYVRGYQDPSFT